MSATPPVSDASIRSVTVPVIAETAEVAQVVEQTGAVRVRKVVRTAYTDAGAALGFQETVETRRVPIGRVVDAPTPPHHRDEVLVVPVYEERWVKQLVLVEELHIRKQRREFTQGLPVALRKEEVVVERLDPLTQQWHSDTGDGLPAASSPSSDS